MSDKSLKGYSKFKGTIEEMREKFLSSFSAEEIIKRFKPEEILQKFKPKERIAGLKPEEIIDYLQSAKKLTKKDKEQLRKILEFRDSNLNGFGK